MDEEIFKGLEWFNENWPNYKKREMFRVEMYKKEGYAVAFEVDPLRVLVVYLIGQEGGLHGALVISDPRQRVDDDKLLCFSMDVSYKSDMMREFKRKYKSSGPNLEKACKESFAELQAKLLEDPNAIVAIAKAAGISRPPKLKTRWLKTIN